MYYNLNHISVFGYVMGTLNVRLPDDLARRLAEEARQAHVPRSDLAREAISEWLARRERARRERRLEAAARVIAEDPALYREARSMAQDFLPLENEASEPGEDVDAERWWR